MDSFQRMYEDADFNDFENYCYEQNQASLQELRKSSQREGVEIEEQNGVLSFDIPAYATGAYLLKEFAQAVTHSKFTPENALKRGKKEYLRVKVNFEASNIAITLYCQASARQPGNGRIHKYGGYTTDHAETNLVDFFTYFQQSLEHPLLPPTSKNLRFDKNWKLMVLLLFEIARRMPSDDVYHHIPIAAGIMMAMHVPEAISTEQFLELFMGTERVRKTAFNWLARRYWEAEWEQSEQCTMMIPVTIRQEFNERMNVFNWTPPQISTDLGYQSSTSSMEPQTLIYLIVIVMILMCAIIAVSHFIVTQKPWGWGLERQIYTEYMPVYGQ